MVVSDATMQTAKMLEAPNAAGIDTIDVSSAASIAAQLGSMVDRA